MQGQDRGIDAGQLIAAPLHLRTARQEREHGAGAFRERAAHGIGDRALRRLAWARRSVAVCDRVHPTGRAQDRRLVHESRDGVGVDGRRHGEQTQIGTQRARDVERERQAEIGVERALVILVEHHRPHARQLRIVQRLSCEHAFGDDLQARRGRDLRLHPHAGAHQPADPRAELHGDAAGGGPRDHAAGFQENDLAVQPRRIEQSGRHQRRLSRARLGDEDRVPMPQCREQVGQDGRDRQVVRPLVPRRRHVRRASPRRSGDARDRPPPPRPPGRA